MSYFIDKNLVRKIKIISIGLVLGGSVMIFVPKYSGTGLRSESLQDVVVPGACYLPTEMETLNTAKISLENQVADLNDQLAQANEDTTKNSENIANTSTKIETLNKELLTDVVLEQKKEILDKAQQELEDRKNIDDLKAELGTKQQYFNEQSASLKTAKTKLTTSTIKLDKLIIQVKAKKSLENNEKFLAEFLTSINKLSLQIADLKVLESSEAELNGAKKRLDTTTSNIRSATHAYKVALSNYNTELAKYKSKYSTYTLPVIRPSKDLTPIYNEQRARYNTQYSDHTRTKNLYTTTYKQSNTVSAGDLKQLEITTSQENKELKASHTQLTNTVTALKIELDTLQNSIDAAIKNYQTHYGYKTTIPDVTAIQSQYDKIEAEYGALKKKNDDIQAEIEKLNNDLATYSNTLNDITGRISALQISINEKNASVTEHTNTIAQNNICPNTETYCRDSIDNDRDSALDCNDSDCATSSECQTGTTENVSTVEIETPRESICNNHADDDFDGAMDCSDSDCANNSYCQLVDVGTAISIPGEVCDNGVDDNTDGVVDCADSGCASDPACHDAPPSSETSCDDGEDNDNNGAVDCADNACSTKDICTNGDEDPVCGNGKVETGEECDNGIDNHLYSENGCDTKCVLHTRSCTDVDPQDGLDDNDPTWSCENKEEDKTPKSCLICQYEDESDNRFYNACNSFTADKKIITKNDISGMEVNECPKNTSIYFVRIYKHGCVAGFGRVGNVIDAILPYLQYNFGLSNKYTGALTIDAIDQGCHSAGGEFYPNSPVHQKFLSSIKFAASLRFWNDVHITQTGNQTYGHTDPSDPDKKDIGSVSFFASLRGNSKPIGGYSSDAGPNKYSEPSVTYNICPVNTNIGCSVPNSSPILIQEPILCGDSNKPERYYCDVIEPATYSHEKYGLYLGRWRKDESFR